MTTGREKGPSGLVTAIYLHTAPLLSDQSAEHLKIAFNGAKEGGVLCLDLSEGRDLKVV